MYWKLQNVGNGLFAGFLKKVLMMMFVFNVCLGRIAAVYGNNVRISGEPEVQLNATSDSLSLTFTLSWDNSWRDNFNWDAVWLFVKYKKEGSTDAWSHLYLGTTQTGTSVLNIETGNTGSQIVGAFVYPRNKGTFNIAGERVTLKAPLNGLSASDITDKNVYFAVSAIEMVLIPYGAYYLGDGVSNNTFKRLPYYGIIPENLDILDLKSGYEYSVSYYASPSCYATNVVDHVDDSRHSASASWYVNNTAPCWWKVDFKVPKTIRFLGISGASNYPTYAPSGIWYLEGSNNDSDWIVLQAIDKWWAPTVSYPVQNSVRISNPGSYRYYRINIPQNSYTMVQNIAMSEVDLYADDALLVDSENSKEVEIKDEEKLSFSLDYPKGYRGFYIMKYELSQEQYCNFLNMLSYTQQKNRIGNNLDNLTRGDYVFGNKNQPSCRNGIAVFAHKGTFQPVVFGCNLNPSEPFFAKDDGQTVACNYMTGADMLSYLDWSGLRPMSELEYEKACRTPKRIVPGEYAWNTTTLQSLGGQSGLSGSTLGTENEIPVSADINANCSMPSFGPVRCGSFGTSSTNQEQSGGTFYGVMEMSGNLGEMCYSVIGGSSLNTSSSNNEYHGDGALAADGNYNVATYWNRSSDVTAFSIRGGSFASPDSLLRVSDRSIMMSYNDMLRDSSVTFRGVRSVSGGVDPGKIDCKDTCPGLITINSVQGAQADCDLGYEWYVKRPGSSEFELIPGEQKEKLVDYDIVSVGTASTVTYTFRRKAISLTGEAYAEFTLTVPNMKWDIDKTIVDVKICHTEKITATSVVAGADYEWRYNENILSATNTYVPILTHFGDNSGEYTLFCKMSYSKCSNSKQLRVRTEMPPKQTFRTCGDELMDDCGNFYPTIQVGKQCWMKQNLRRTDVEHCPVGDPVDMEKYGVHYYWKIVMNGEGASSANPSGVRGLCPEGWHLPSVSEWQEAIDAYGGASIAGGYMRTEMNMSLAGHGYGCSNAQLEIAGLYGSTENDGYNNGIRLYLHKDTSPQVAISKYMGMAAYPYSYRCLKD